MTIRVLLADDQELVRAGFRMILETQENIEVAGEAGDGIQAVAATRRLQPDVVLMDIRMPNLDGLPATKQIVAARSASRVLILTTFDLDEYVYQALAAGASGFLLKNAPPEQLISAVWVVAAGDALLAPSITRRVIEQFTRLPPPGGTDALVGLTEREWEVLKLVARGAVQRRDRRGAGRQRRHGEEPRGSPAGQAAPAGPGPGRGAGLRIRPDTARNRVNGRRSLQRPPKHHDVAVVDADGRPVAKRRIGDDAPVGELLEVLVDAGHSPPAPIPVAIETTRALLVLRH